MLEMEAAAILASTWFRASRRSCEFLLYLVECTLNGRSDLLKERTIGVAVLGRDASYDTGSDASVRVRASEVRRRLMSYYSECSSRRGWRIELPAGSYVPRFVEEAKERATVTFVPGSNPALVIEGANAKLYRARGAAAGGAPAVRADTEPIDQQFAARPDCDYARCRAGDFVGHPTQERAMKPQKH